MSERPSDLVLNFRAAVRDARWDQNATAGEIADAILAQPFVADLARKVAAWDDPERVARMFHEAYERLAPDHGYETRRESAVPWEAVPEQNRALMVATVAAIAAALTAASPEDER